MILDAVKERAGLSRAFYTRDAELRYPETVSALKELLGDEAYEITEEISKKLADTQSPQGVYALAKRLDKSCKSVKIDNGGKFIVLNRLQDPGNVGTVLRCSDAVGVSGVFLCGCCDLYNPKLVRSTMGSLFRLSVEIGDYSEVIRDLHAHGVTTCAAVVDKAAKSLRDFDFPQNSAVVIGNEGSGLSDEEAGLCDEKITIKMNGTIESLNAASAASIFLWELTKGDKHD